MAYRFVARSLVILLLAFFLSTCTIGPLGRLYSHCFVHSPQVGVEYAKMSTFVAPCTKYPNMWVRDFPLDVAVVPYLYADAVHVAAGIEQEVGHPMFSVRMRKPYETVDAPDDGTDVYMLINSNPGNYCEKRGNRPCIGYTHWFRRYGKFYHTVVIYPRMIGSQAHRRTVIKHELGHVLGLKHVPDPSDIMYHSIPRKVVNKYFSKRDIAVIRSLIE